MPVYPVFPLNTVLSPGGLLPLRIFEPRYLDMVSCSLRQSSPFVISLLTTRDETSRKAETENVGVTARIFDWESLSDGLLGITVLGERKVRLSDSVTQSDGLLLARAEYLPDEKKEALPAEAEPLAHLLRRILAELPLPYSEELCDYGNAGWVADRLTEVLPVLHKTKQALLEEPLPIIRLDRMKAELSRLHLLGG